ncbi:hypothetical protein AAG906_039694 [Vitis piasezkii]
MPSLQDIESMMVGIDDMEEFKRVFLIFACATLLASISRLKVVTRYAIHEHRRKESVRIKGCLMIFYFSISNFPAMYVELTTPRIAAWNDFLVKQRIKLELEMLGGFGKLVSTSAEQDETEKNKAPAVDDPVDPDENEDFDVICARMEATQRQITDAQSHLNSLIASYNRDVKGCRKTQRRRWCVLCKRGSLHPEPHNMLVLVHSCMDNNVDVAPQGSKKYDHKSKMKMLCAYGGYGVTREQLQCLVGKNFIDIPVSYIFFFMYSFSILIGSHVNNMSQIILVITDVIGMYAILYMQHWDGSGLNRTINSERMSLERLKFATHMVLDSENEIGEMFTDKLIEEDEFDADQKDAFKTMSERQKKPIDRLEKPKKALQMS